MPDHDSTDMIGKAFGRYRIQERLGEGGMGSVWKADDTLLHRVVALKFLSAELVDSPEARQRFLREARSASVLEHPGIATVFDAGEVEGTPYLAVQFVEGMTLSERIRQGPIPVAEAVEIHRQAAEALAHAHSRKVLHRDISSRNLMLKSDGSVVLVDFGLAKRSDMTQLTRTGTTQGTIAYLAPEVLEGSPATEASDRYSLGVVLYEMLTGELPFRGERVEAVMLKIMTEDPEPPSALKSDVPPEVDRLVLQLLAKDPEARGAGEAIGAVGAPKRRLRTIQQDETAPLRSTSSDRWRIGRWQLALMVAVLLIGGAAAIVLLNPATPIARPRSIAVLPLTNRSVNPEESDYIAEGVAVFLSQRLTEIKGLAVTPWMTSRNIADSTQLEYVAERLKVDALLTGTIGVKNGEVRLELTLVNGRNGRALWSQEFISRASRVHEVESAALLALLDRIHDPLSEEARQHVMRAPSENADAYSLYLRGVQSLQAGDREGSDEALDLFSRSIALDTAFAEPYSGLGAALLNRYFFEWGGGQEQLLQARQSFEKALTLQPESISARKGLVQVYLELDDELAIALEGLPVRMARELMTLDPTSVEHRLAAGSILAMDNLQKAAIALLRGVLIDDPSNVEARWFLVIALAWNGEVDECIRACNDYETLVGEDAEHLHWKAQCLAARGEVNQAISVAERSMDLFDEGRATSAAISLGYLQHRAGLLEDSRRTANFVLSQTGPRLITHPNNHRTRMTHAAAQALLGLAGDFDRTTSVPRIGDALGNYEIASRLILGREALVEDWICRRVSREPDTFWWVTIAAAFPEFLQRPRVADCTRSIFEGQHALSDQFLREFNIPS